MTKVLEIDGVKVKDAKKPRKLVVIEDDCKKANRKKPSSCAVARACGRLDDVEEARIHLSRVYLKKDGTWLRYETPKAMRSEIIAFDRGGEFEPGEYWLREIPPHHTRTARLKRREDRKKNYATENTGRGTKKPHRKPHVVTNVRMGPA